MTSRWKDPPHVSCHDKCKDCHPTPFQATKWMGRDIPSKYRHLPPWLSSSSSKEFTSSSPTTAPSTSSPARHALGPANFTSPGTVHYVDCNYYCTNCAFEHDHLACPICQTPRG
eukprot:PhF_6_TR37237/c0_g1_i1/m.54934